MNKNNPSCDVIMLATKEIEGYARHSSALWSAYCAHKGYQFHCYSERLVSDMHVNWSKIEMVRQHLAKSDADIVTLVDADTYVCNPQMCLKDMLNRRALKAMMFSPDTNRTKMIERPLNFRAALEHRALRLPNAGFIVMENSPFALQFFEDWMDLARNDLKHLADIHPRNQRVLWKGLYFQNRDKVGLFKGEVERLGTERQLFRAMKKGCDVVHFRGGMPKPLFDRLIENFSSTLLPLMKVQVEAKRPC